MRILPAPLSGAKIIEQERHEDSRGFFARAFCSKEFADAGLPTQIVQMNESFSRAQHTLRGMHYQLPPHADSRLVRCISGAIQDFIIDLRPDSPTFGQHCSVELTAENRNALLVPKHFAHGFMTLQANTVVLYAVDDFYAPSHERGIRWNDPRFGIKWPAEPRSMSDKDAGWPDFDENWHLSAKPDS